MTILNIITQKAGKIAQTLYMMQSLLETLVTNLASSLITTSLELVITVTNFPFAGKSVYMGFNIANKPLPCLCVNVTFCKEMYLIINRPISTL